MENEAQQIVPPTQPPPLTPPTAKRSSKRLIIPIALLLVIAIIIGATMFGYYNGKAKTHSQDTTSQSEPTDSTQPIINPETSPTIPPEVSPVIDQSTGAIIYKNNRYHYSITISQKWIAASNSSGTEINKLLSSNDTNLVIDSTDQENSTVINIQVSGPEDINRPIFSTWIENEKSNFNKLFDITNQFSSTIAGANTVVFEGEQSQPYTQFAKLLLFESPKKDVSFIITISANTIKELASSDQILSTFKFITE